jgi:hypothetical protein
MIRNLLTTTVLFLTVAFSFSQADTIINQRMENWENVGQDTEEPIQWNSNKTGGGNATSGPNTLRRDTSTLFGGQYCARVRSGSTIGIVVNGALTTGRVEAPSFTKSEGYIRAIPTNAPYRMPFVSRPDSFVFWIRYSPNGSDYARVEARLHVGYAYAPEAPVGGNHPDSTQNIIARALWNNSAATNKTITNWTRISIPFTYVDNRIPQYILITSTSSGDQNGGTNGSTMWLDEFRVIYNPTLQLSGNKNYGTFYVSANSGASINVPYTATGTYVSGNTFTAQLSNAAGSFASPVALGTLSSLVSGAVNGTIPAGTAAGSGYLVRVVSNNPPIISDTGTATIVLVASSIAPSSAQTIAANANGTQLNVTETAGATSREWKFATTAGGPYQSFTAAQTNTSYTPNFAAAGTYFVVCETTYPGGTVVRSNEVQVNVVSNSIAPAAPQSLLVNAAGTTLTVTESSTASSRVWKFTTTSGSNYQVFNPNETSSTFTPQFATAGNYYVVCESVISGVTVRSNEVLISVNSVTLAVTSVTGFPIDFSPNAPNKNVTVTYAVNGGSFNAGNIFTAQLSDTNGSFANPLNIGTLNATTGGTINAIVPNTTVGGTQYRVRVIASNPAVFGTDNGTDLVIDQFSNSIAAPTKQTIQYATNGNPLIVSESQIATSRQWKFGSSLTGPFQSFSPANTGVSYLPNFALPGTYFVVCTSFNQFGDSVTSNAVEFEVTNGTQLTTLTVVGAPFYISPKANATGSVAFTSNIIFDANNQFTAELSDANGSFGNPTAVGSLNGNTISPIAITIPNGIQGSNQYRLRVVSSSPAAIGTQSNSFAVIPFEISITPNDTQNAVVNIPANTLVANETHTAIKREWLVSFISGSFYNSFSPKETGVTINPVFLGAGTAYVVCRSVNASDDTVQSGEVVFLIEEPNAIGEVGTMQMKAWFGYNRLNVEWKENSNATLSLFNIAGSKVLNEQSISTGLNTFETVDLPAGVYLMQVSFKGETKQLKLRK